MKRTNPPTKPRRAATRNSKPQRHQRVPRGLRAVFSAMQSDQYREIYAATTPEPFLDVLKALEGGGFTEALASAARREFPGTGFGHDGKQRASECAEVFALSSFWAGVAACWQTMTAINGKDGAR